MAVEKIDFTGAVPRVLEPLTRKRHWVVWQYENHGEDKPRKVPYQANRPGAHAKVNDPKTWSTYDEARKCRAKDGIGFVLFDSGFAALDLDHCFDGHRYVPWAQELIDACKDNTYCEFSPSGRGIRIIGLTEKSPDIWEAHPGGGAKLEAY